LVIALVLEILSTRQTCGTSNSWQADYFIPVKRIISFLLYEIKNIDTTLIHKA